MAGGEVYVSIDCAERTLDAGIVRDVYCISSSSLRCDRYVSNVTMEIPSYGTRLHTIQALPVAFSMVC